MSFTSEFKEFAVKGNVMDLAVGVIIGAAFGKIVDSVVNDLIMPLVGRVAQVPRVAGDNPDQLRAAARGYPHRRPGP